MTNLYKSNTHSIVTRRVQTIYLLQKIFSIETFSAILLTGSLWGIGREVWVARVFQNMPSVFDIQDTVRFSIAAFIDTRIIVQVLACVSLVTALCLIATAFRSVIRNGIRTSQFAQ